MIVTRGGAGPRAAGAAVAPAIERGYNGRAMADDTNAVRDLTADAEYVELPPHLVREQLLRLFNNQIQRDYNVADFATMDGHVVIKLKRRTPRPK